MSLTQRFHISALRPAALVAVCLVTLGVLPTHAAVYNLATMVGNSGFETGLTGWSYTGDTVNATTYLTASEWSTQTWSTSSPFYSDAALAGYYPGTPWGRDPNITHIDQTGVAGDATTVITAPLGLHFVGSRQDGYEGHYRRDVSEPAQPAGGDYDTNFQLTSAAVSRSFLAGDTFTLTVYAVRGRTGQDWAQQNASTTGSASELSVRLSGGTFVTPLFNFTNWAADGVWASQTFTWQLSANTSSIRLLVTGQNHNHHRFVAADLDWQPTVPTRPSTWGGVKALYSNQ